MAVDMSNVKQIMHNNKEVIKIEDSSGHVIWQKGPSASWHTLWEGTQECSAWAWYGNWYKYTPSSPVTLCTIDTSTIPDLSNVQCRITFSKMEADGNSTSYIPSTKPTSPYTFTDITKGRIVLEAKGIASNDAYWCMALIAISRSGNTTYFRASVSRSGTPAQYEGYKGEITVTKIELYY